MGSRWGAHGGGPALGIHLIVDEAPLLQEGVDPAESQGSDDPAGPSASTKVPNRSAPPQPHRR